MNIDNTNNISLSGVVTDLSTGVLHSTSGFITSSLVVNGDVSASAAIVDTKLATISTAGKVSNSATTATSNNTASTIMLRSAAGLTNLTTLQQGAGQLAYNGTAHTMLNNTGTYTLSNPLNMAASKQILVKYTFLTLVNQGGNMAITSQNTEHGFGESTVITQDPIEVRTLFNFESRSQSVALHTRFRSNPSKLYISSYIEQIGDGTGESNIFRLYFNGEHVPVSALADGDEFEICITAFGF